MYYLKARYYNPEWRRFISPDNSSYLDPESANGLNLYAYCNNDPVNYADPSGHWIETVLDVISIGWSLYDLINNPTWENMGWLALDVCFALIPIIPSISRLAKGASSIDNVVDVAHGFTKMDNVHDAIVIGNNMDRVKGVANIQNAIYYLGYEPLNLLADAGKIGDATFGMKVAARIDNAQWLIDKINKGYRILDIGRDNRTLFKMFMSAYGMERRILLYLRLLGKVGLIGQIMTRTIRLVRC